MSLSFHPPRHQRLHAWPGLLPDNRQSSLLRVVQVGLPCTASSVPHPCAIRLGASDGLLFRWNYARLARSCNHRRLDAFRKRLKQGKLSEWDRGRQKSRNALLWRVGRLARKVRVREPHRQAEGRNCLKPAHSGAERRRINRFRLMGSRAAGRPELPLARSSPLPAGSRAAGSGRRRSAGRNRSMSRPSEATNRATNDASS